MDQPFILYEVADRVATLILNRPEARNALSPQLLAQLLDALDRAAGDSEVGVVVITGAGDKAFCAGGDLGGGGKIPAPYERYDGSRLFVDMLRKLYHFPKPTIARVNGYCLAGGFGLALACDFLIAHEGVEFGTPEIDRGLFPMMILAPIVRSIPRKAVLELILMGEKIPAKRAFDLGIASAIVGANDLDAEVNRWATKLASKSPVVLQLGKRALATMDGMTYDQALEYLNTMLFVNTQTEDAMEGIMAFFQKRAPKWKGK